MEMLKPPELISKDSMENRIGSLYANQTKAICSNKLPYIEIKKLRSLFYDNSYPNWIFDKILDKFCHPHTTQNDDATANLSYLIYLWWKNYLIDFIKYS